MDGTGLLLPRHYHLFFSNTTQVNGMLKSNLIQISLVRHVFSNRRDMIVHSDRIIIVMLEITAVHGQIKVAWGPWQEPRKGPYL